MNIPIAEDITKGK